MPASPCRKLRDRRAAGSPGMRVSGQQERVPYWNESLHNSGVSEKPKKDGVPGFAAVYW